MKKKILIITILGIVLIAAGIGTYAALSKKDKPKKETVKEETTSRKRLLPRLKRLRQRLQPQKKSQSITVC